MTYDELRNLFGYHPATAVTAPKHEAVRGNLLDAAFAINDLFPDCDEKIEAIKCLRMAMFWANAGVACSLAPLELHQEP